MERMRRWAATVVLAVLSALSVVAAHAAPAAVSPAALHPRLTTAVSPDPYPRVAGTGWTPGTRLTVTVRFYGLRAVKRLRTTGSGTFGVGLQGTQWCSALTITARDPARHRAAIHGAAPTTSCPAPPAGTSIVIHVLTPQQMQVHQLVLDITAPPASSTVHVGDVLYLYDPAGEGMGHLVRGDTDHFQFIEQGAVPPCPPNASCPLPSGEFWRLTATHAGEGIVTVSLACRQSSPPCMAPDRAIRVTILP